MERLGHGLNLSSPKIKNKGISLSALSREVAAYTKCSLMSLGVV